MAGFFSCDEQPFLLEEDDPPTIFEPVETKDVRLAKIVRYSNSTASQGTGETTYSYNENGDLIKKTYFDALNNTMFCIYFIEYKYSGYKMIKKSLFNCNLDDFPEGTHTEYFYEGDLLVKEVLNYGQGDFPTLYEYDERGNLIKRSWYVINPPNLSPAPNTIYDHKYTYDDKDRLILEENSLVGVSDYDYKYIKYIYDKYGREKKAEYFNAN